MTQGEKYFSAVPPEFSDDRTLVSFNGLTRTALLTVRAIRSGATICCKTCMLTPNTYSLKGLGQQSSPSLRYLHVFYRIRRVLSIVYFAFRI